MRRALVVASLLLLAACERRAIHVERVVRKSVDERAELATTDAMFMRVRPPEPPRLRDECSLGQRGQCLGTIIPIPAGEPLHGCPCTSCMLMADGSKRWNRSSCNTPLVVAFDDRPVEFTRADAEFSVGVSARTEWVSAATPWIALDRDGSGCIESARELFAGFAALAELDANGDGVVDGRDPGFAELVLWSDRNQDKRCTADELEPLSRRLDAVPLGFVARPETLGSYEGETTSLRSGGRVVDVHLAPLGD